MGSGKRTVSMTGCEERSTWSQLKSASRPRAVCRDLAAGAARGAIRDSITSSMVSTLPLSNSERPGVAGGGGGALSDGSLRAEEAPVLLLDGGRGPERGVASESTPLGGR